MLFLEASVSTNFWSYQKVLWNSLVFCVWENANRKKVGRIFFGKISFKSMFHLVDLLHLFWMQWKNQGPKCFHTTFQYIKTNKKTTTKTKKIWRPAASIQKKKKIRGPAAMAEKNVMMASFLKCQLSPQRKYTMRV